MLKAKALCAVNGNVAPEIKPLMSVVETPAPVADTRGNDLRNLIGGNVSTCRAPCCPGMNKIENTLVGLY